MKDTRRWTVLEFLAETPKSAAEWKAAVEEDPWRGSEHPWGVTPRLTQLDVPIQGEEDVASLDVPVDDPAAMQVPQRQQQLLANHLDLLLRQPLLQLCRQRKRTPTANDAPAPAPNPSSLLEMPGFLSTL